MRNRVEKISPRIKQLISKGETIEALNMLVDFMDKVPQINELILQSSRLSRLMKDLRMGLIDRKDVAIEQVQIEYAILEILNEIEIPDKTTGLKFNISIWYVFLAVIVIAFLFLAGYYSFGKQDLVVEIFCPNNKLNFFEGEGIRPKIILRSLNKYGISEGYIRIKFEEEAFLLVNGESTFSIPDFFGTKIVNNDIHVIPIKKGKHSIIFNFENSSIFTSDTLTLNIKDMSANTNLKKLYGDWLVLLNGKRGYMTIHSPGKGQVSSFIDGYIEDSNKKRIGEIQGIIDGGFMLDIVEKEEVRHLQPYYFHFIESEAGYIIMRDDDKGFVAVKK
jgi:hypothetical protein